MHRADAPAAGSSTSTTIEADESAARAEWLGEWRRLRPRYETPLISRTGDGTWKLPDFTFLDDADEPAVFWEHLGMLDVRDYADGWVRKRRWYAGQGYIEGRDLLWTSEVDGLDAGKVDKVIAQVKQRLALA